MFAGVLFPSCFGGGHDTDCVTRATQTYGLFLSTVVPNMEHDNLIGEGSSDSEGDCAASTSEERAVPEKRALDTDHE